MKSKKENAEAFQRAPAFQSRRLRRRNDHPIAMIARPSTAGEMEMSMAMKLMNAVLEADSDWSASVQLVLLVLCKHADESGSSCYPRIDTITDETHLSRSGVVKALKELKKIQLVQSKQRRHRSAERTIDVDRIARLPKRRRRCLESHPVPSMKSLGTPHKVTQCLSHIERSDLKTLEIARSFGSKADRPAVADPVSSLFPVAKRSVPSDASPIVGVISTDAGVIATAEEWPLPVRSSTYGNWQVAPRRISTPTKEERAEHLRRFELQQQARQAEDAIEARRWRVRSRLRA